MKYTPGLMVGQLSGKAGSTVASRNRGGSYFRTRVIPKLVRNAATTRVRATFTGAAQAWRELQDAQRQAWSALGTNMTKKNSLGETIHLSGINAFLSVNRTLVTIGQFTVSDAPARVTPVDVSSVQLNATAGGPGTTTVVAGATSATQNLASTAALYEGAVVFFATAGVFRTVVTVVDPTHVILNDSVASTTAENVTWTDIPVLTLDYVPSPVPADTSYAVYMSAPLSAGISRPSKSAYRFIEVESAGSNSPADLALSYAFVFGAPISGQKIFVRVVPISNQGFQGTGVETFAVVA